MSHKSEVGQTIGMRGGSPGGDMVAADDWRWA